MGDNINLSMTFLFILKLCIFTNYYLFVTHVLFTIPREVTVGGQRGVYVQVFIVTEDIYIKGYWIHGRYTWSNFQRWHNNESHFLFVFLISSSLENMAGSYYKQWFIFKPFNITLFLNKHKQLLICKMIDKWSKIYY